MRTCPKCGRANQPTRKYCVRCGGNLISVEKKPQTIAEPASVPTPEPEVKPTPAPAAPASEARVTTNDEWVKPSSVSKDRVRTADGTSKPKSEMEKAMEAFAKADKVGIEEEGEGIVETRMLRASEVQELMGEFDEQPSPTPTSAPTPSTPPPSAPAPQPAASTPPPAGPPGAPASAPAVEPTPEKVVAPEPKPTPAPTPPPAMASKTPSPAPPPTPAPKPTSSAIPEIEAIISALPDPAYRQDPQIIGIVNDLKNLHTELAQFNSDLDTVRVRLESEVQDYWNVAEVKRIHFESLEEQLRLAKQEWNDATKVYQNANKRMKTEISSREKRIKDIQKRIEKAESGIGKRVKDLDKEKEKKALSG
jgi:hypothetical protein